MNNDKVGEWGPEYVEELVGLWEDLLQELYKYQGDYDAAVVHNYLKWKNSSHHNSFLFTIGEPMLVQARTAGKLSMQSKRPFWFVQHVGPV